MDSEIREKLEKIIEVKRKTKILTIISPVILLLINLVAFKFIGYQLTLTKILLLGAFFIGIGIYLYIKECKNIGFLENPQIVEYEGIIERVRSGKSHKYVDKSTGDEYFEGMADLDDFRDKHVRGIVEDQSKIFITLEEVSTKDVI